MLFEQGDIGLHIQKHSPWIPKENVRYSYAWIKGAAGPASTQQVTKFTNAIKQEMKKRGVEGMKLGVDFIDINMIQIFKDAKIDWVDGMTPMMEARAVKNEDEQECFRQVGAIGDAAHWEFMKFLKPGLTENQLTAHIMEFLYNVPGMEDVEDVIVSSGRTPGRTGATSPTASSSRATWCSWISRRSRGTATSRATTARTGRQRAEPGTEGHLRDGA